MKRLLFVVTVVLVSATFSWTQEQLGIRTSNLAGVNGLILNPASSYNNPLPWDVNLLEFGQFFSNNYMFVENFRLLDVVTMPKDYVLRYDLEKKDLPTPTDKFVVDFYRSNGKTFQGDVLTSVMGPSLWLRLGDFSSVGIYTRARAAFSARKVPGVLGYYEYMDQPFDSTFLATPFKLSGMAWSEIGLNYAQNADTDYGEISFGGTVKFLQGYTGGYGRLEQPMSFRQIRGNRLVGEPGSASYALANTILETSELELRQLGSGAAVDFGVSFTIWNEEDDYRWKFGAALLDVGMIRFDKSAEQHRVVVSDSTSLSLTDLQQYQTLESLDSLIKEFSLQTLKNPDASLQARAFSMWLPTALSLQAEVRVVSSLFVNATLVQGLPLHRNAVRRSAVFAITPRFEHRWFELALPISMVNWQSLRTGLAARMGFIWFGTDDLGSIMSASNFDSTDFYVAFKVNPFRLNFGRHNKNKSGWYGGRKSYNGNRGKLKCPTF